MEIYYKTFNDCYDNVCDEIEFYKNKLYDCDNKRYDEIVKFYKNGLSTGLSVRNCDECDIKKYKELVTNTQKKAEKNNKKIQAQKKGMKKLQRKYQKLKEENKCLKKQLCER